MEEKITQTAQETASTPISSTAKKGVNKLLLGGVGLLAILGITLVPINGTSLLSKGLDAVGLSKAALLVDSVTGKISGGTFDISTLNVKDGASCENAWNQIKEGTRKVTSSEQDGTVSIGFQSGEKKSVANLELYSNSKTDMAKYVSDATINGKITLDFPYIISLIKQASPASADLLVDIEKLNLGVINAEAKTQFFSNYGEQFISVNGAKVTANDLKFEENSFGDAVKLVDGEYTQAQKDAYKKLQESISKLTETKPKEILSDETGKALAKSVCDIFEDIKVSSFGDYTLSNGQKVNGRKAQLIFKKLNLEVAYNKSVELSKLFVKDARLKNFIKTNKDTFAEVAKNLSNFSNLSGGAIDSSQIDKFKDLSQIDYDKQIDDAFTELEKSIQEGSKDKPDFAEAQKSLDYLEFAFENTDLYFDAKGEVVASDFKSTTGISSSKIDEAIKAAQDQAKTSGLELDTKALRNIFSGKLVGSIVSGKNIINNSPSISTPTNSQSLNDFVNSVSTKKSVQDFIKQVTDKFSSIAPITNGDVNSLTLPSDSFDPTVNPDDLIFQ